MLPNHCSAPVLRDHKCCTTCLQGLLEAADRDAIQRGMKMKVSTVYLGIIWSNAGHFAVLRLIVCATDYLNVLQLTGE